MIAPARIAAYDIALALASHRADLPTAIAAARERLEDDRDRALAADIATGVERWRARLDHVIAHVAKRTLTRLDAEIVAILRLSAYQLLHLTRVPAAAVVDDAVDLARRAGKKSAAGFVNAVLRGISRQRNALPLPSRPDDDRDHDAALDYLSVTLSHPRWLAARWLQRVGLDRAEAWMQFNNQPARLTLRTNTIKTSTADLMTALDRHDVSTHAAPFAPDALVVDTGHPLREPGLDDGLFVVQDEASQLVALLAGAHAGARVLDTCASPGGKSTAIASRLDAGARLIACDVRDRRMALLAQTVRRTGAANVRLVQADLLAPLPFAARFSTVIVDAPCSGLGTLRRDPDIKWRRHEDDLVPLARAQLRMLHHAAAVVAPGGRLVYATCSTEPEENEDVAARFLGEAREFQPVNAARAHPAIVPSLVDEAGHLRTSPDAHGLEGFFAAVFERARDL